MQITIVSFLLGLLLIAAPLYLFNYYRVDFLSAALESLLKFVACIFAMAIFVYYVMKIDSVVLNICFFLLMAAITSAATIRRSRLSMQQLFLPVFAGFLGVAFLYAIYLLMVSMHVGRPFDARWLIPMGGVLMGGIMETSIAALQSYYKGIERHRQLYDYLLGNGATPAEASRQFVRRALQKSALPLLKVMPQMVVCVCPVVMWALILGGMPVFSAAALQVLLLVAVFSASVLSVFVVLTIARRFFSQP